MSWLIKDATRWMDKQFLNTYTLGGIITSYTTISEYMYADGVVYFHFDHDGHTHYEIAGRRVSAEEFSRAVSKKLNSAR